MIRKIVQISVVPETEMNYEGLYALADDGTIFYAQMSVTLKQIDKVEWKKIPEIPQELSETKTNNLLKE